MRFSKGNNVGYGNLEYLKKKGIDVLSMIRVDEEPDGGRAICSDVVKAPEQLVTFAPKIKRQASYSPAISRRNKHRSLHDFGLHDPLLQHTHDSILQPNGGVSLNRARSAHDLRTLPTDSPVHIHTRVRSVSSVYDIELFDREEVLSQVSTSKLYPIKL